jgi:hypothetical protein
LKQHDHHALACIDGIRGLMVMPCHFDVQLRQMPVVEHLGAELLMVKS